MEIEISGLSGIGNVLSIMSKYTGDKTKQKCAELAKRLCEEVGMPIIKAIHGNHSKIIPKATQSGYMISVEGEDVLFIEFGTGDMAGVMDALYDKVPDVVGQGTWSAEHAQMYTRYGFWVFGNQIYHYTEPHPALYYAYEAMVKELPRIAEEVFHG